MSETTALATTTTQTLAKLVDEARELERVRTTSRRATVWAATLGVATVMGLTAAIGLPLATTLGLLALVLSGAGVTAAIVRRRRTAPAQLRDAYERASRLVDHGKLEVEDRVVLEALLEQAKPHLDESA